MRRRKREDVSMPLMDHIRALRKVLLISAYAIAIGAIIGWIYSDPVYNYIAQPALQLDVDFITTTPMEPALVKLKVSLIVGIVVALPIIFWQIWSFILPALKQHERKYLYLISPTSLVLFLIGVAFAFYFVIPIGMRVLLYLGHEAVDSTIFLTKSSYLTFIIRFVLTFGIVFQMPVFLLLLIRIGLLSPHSLAKYRKYALFGILVIVMLVSPTPDLITQGLMVLPMYLLYELSIWLGYIVKRRREKALEG